MQDQLDKIGKLRCAVEALELTKKKIQMELDNEVAVLQQTCDHKEFIAEDNGDYHKPGYYYTCTCCNYFTTQRPSRGIIINL